MGMSTTCLVFMSTSVFNCAKLWRWQDDAEWKAFSEVGRYNNGRPFLISGIDKIPFGWGEQETASNIRSNHLGWWCSIRYFLLKTISSPDPLIHVSVIFLDASHFLCSSRFFFVVGCAYPLQKPLEPSWENALGRHSNEFPIHMLMRRYDASYGNHFHKIHLHFGVFAERKVILSNVLDWSLKYGYLNWNGEQRIACKNSLRSVSYMPATSIDPVRFCSSKKEVHS